MFDAFRVNRDKVMDLKTSLNIQTNVGNFEPASPKTILISQFIFVCDTLDKQHAIQSETMKFKNVLAILGSAMQSTTYVYKVDKSN